MRTQAVAYGWGMPEPPQSPDAPEDAAPVPGSGEAAENAESAKNARTTRTIESADSTERTESVRKSTRKRTRSAGTHDSPTAPQSRARPAAPRSPLALAALATVAVPSLHPARLALPQTRTAVLQVVGVIDTRGRHWEVMEALDAAAGAALEAEAEILRRVGKVADSGLVSFNVSRAAGSLRSDEAHVQVRSHVEGRPIQVSSLRPGPGLSAGLGKALGELHEIPTSVVSESGMPVYDAEEVRERWLTVLDDAAATGKVPPALLSRWEEALEETALWRFRPTVVHGDLAEENVLAAGGSVVGLRGWTQAHVGDPAEDMAWVYSTVPVDCLGSIEDAYDIARSEGVDKHLRDRAELVSELSLARWLLHGARSGAPSVVADAVDMLTDLAAQVGDEPLVEPTTPRLAPVPGERHGADPEASTSPVTMVPVDSQED